MQNEFESLEEAARVANIRLLLEGELPMRRDDDLLRKLMLDMEADPEPIMIYSLTDGADEDGKNAYFHLRLLTDEGFLEEMGNGGGVFRMTNKGHDFVAAVRSDTVWGQTQKVASKVSGVSLSILKDIAIGIVRQELTKMGVPLG